ncbi:MAG: septation protein IspZ [Pseudomonadota bacterium]
MSKAASGAATAADKANQIWGDLVPVMSFVVVYNGLRFIQPEGGFLSYDALFWATGALIGATALIVGQKVFKGQKVPPFLIVTSLIVGVFGLLGILGKNEAFLYVKVTLQNLFLAGLIFVPMAFGRNVWKAMFKDVFDLPDFAWTQLSIRWGMFFIAMALWNEYLYRTFAPIAEQCLPVFGIPIAPCEAYTFGGLTFGAKDAQDVWANWKIGNMVITFLFGAANVPYTLKHLRQGDDPARTPQSAVNG